MTPNTTPMGKPSVPPRHAQATSKAAGRCDSLTAQTATATTESCASDANVGAQLPRLVLRGLTDRAPTSVLRHAIRVRALGLANRLRVIRTIDVAAACFPERDYKASLTAAQRAMRALVKAGLLHRYRSDRFQTIYGLTERGAQWLREDAGIEAAASVRRVSDMTNPEHRLWAQFLVLCGEARGLHGWTEVELLKHLNQGLPDDKALSQGPLRVQVKAPKGGLEVKVLRPDALLQERDGATWVEVDRSARGSSRAADLRALVLSIGAPLATGQALRRVVVFTRTERIHHRVVALLVQLHKDAGAAPLARGRRQLRASAEGEYQVWETCHRDHPDGRSQLEDVLVGHVIVQVLPTWLPKVRLDGRSDVSMAGWFPENYLPYRRPTGLSAWVRPVTPLLGHTRNKADG
jgi:hypothetical protein